MAFSLAQSAILFPAPLMKPDEKQVRPLELKWADLKVRENANEHHTADFDSIDRQNNAQLIIRRGQAFTIDLEFYRNFDGDSDFLKLVFECGR